MANDAKRVKELPEKYYLDHFLEFTQHLRRHASMLLREQDHRFFARFDALCEDQKCLLVRMFNRSHPCMKIQSLVNYKEIHEPELQLERLIHQGFVATLFCDLESKPTSLSKSNAKSNPTSNSALNPPLNPTPPTDWLNVLTKPELCSLTEALSDTVATLYPPKKSANKQAWLHWANTLPATHLRTSAVAKDYVFHTQEPILTYLLFLYFGHLDGKLNQFSMRDLGVMNTQQSAAHDKPRFEHKAEAESCFEYRKILKALKQTAVYQSATPDWKNLPKPIGEQAETLHHKALFYLGQQSQADDPEQALTIWQTSQDPRAIEKRIRLLYQLNQKDQALAQLNQIIEQPPNEGLLVFAEDFLARKFHQKRTSLLTDMIRQHPPLLLEEAYNGYVEQGVMSYYKALGYQAIHCENSVWRALFALTFWQELYDNPNAGLHSEFDRLPACLKQNTFYNDCATDIEARLNTLTSTPIFIQFIQKQYARAYGQPNGLFVWHADLLHWLQLLIQHSSLVALTEHLRSMSQNVRELSDGYPDLMLIKQESIRFVEVKSPNDQLRRNQLVTLQHLKRAGFDTQVRSVRWQFNPEQTYCVVDVETTGGGSGQHRVTEIGMVKIKQGKVIDRWQSLVNPMRLIPKYITELTGISNDMVKDAPRFEDVAEDVFVFLQDSIFVAHNVGFDYGFFRHEFGRLNINFKAPKLCTVKLAKQYFPGLASYSLGKLCNDLDITLDQHHRALADAQAAAEILLKVNAVRQQMPNKTEK